MSVSIRKSQNKSEVISRRIDQANQEIAKANQEKRKPQHGLGVLSAIAANKKI